MPLCHRLAEIGRFHHLSVSAEPHDLAHDLDKSPDLRGHQEAALCFLLQTLPQPVKKIRHRRFSSFSKVMPRHSTGVLAFASSSSSRDFSNRCPCPDGFLKRRFVRVSFFFFRVIFCQIVDTKNLATGLYFSFAVE